jgi:hypothetical protein
MNNPTPIQLLKSNWKQFDVVNNFIYTFVEYDMYLNTEVSDAFYYAKLYIIYCEKLYLLLSKLCEFSR